MADSENLKGNNKIQFSAVPMWFWIAFLLGVVVRICLTVFTDGTYDVNIWQKHAEGVSRLGLINYYHANAEMNHPPFISFLISFLLKISSSNLIPFKVLLRMPFVLLDAATMILLLRLLDQNRRRFFIAALYWLNPLSIIFSAYHGNTDISMGFFLLLAVSLFAEQKITAAAVVIGVSLWVKLPGILAIPAFLFFIPDWRRRITFLFTIGLTGIATYLPVLFLDPNIVFKNVIGYQGQMIQTTAGNPVWGLRIFLADFISNSAWRQQTFLPSILFYLRHNTWFCLIPILFLSWSRREKKTIPQLCLTITGIYSILYGFSSFWSFQYFAWSIPFWFLAPLSFAIPAIVLAGGYIYSLYWYLCGNPWLQGAWDFIGHPYWPRYIELIRNCCVAFFFCSACIFIINGIRPERTELKYASRKARVRKSH